VYLFGPPPVDSAQGPALAFAAVEKVPEVPNFTHVFAASRHIPDARRRLITEAISTRLLNGDHSIVQGVKPSAIPGLK
jgi:hypothetical protein